jgi:hypothetical protein
VIQLSTAYSFKYIAQLIPNGVETSAVIRVNITVPVMAGRIPPFVIPSFGRELTNAHDRDEAPLLIRSQRITTKKKHTVPVQSNNVPHSMSGVSFFIIWLGIFGTY